MRHELTAATVVLLSIFLFFACKKIDPPQKSAVTVDPKSALNVSANLPSPIKRVAETIRRQDGQHAFWATFVEKDGIPVWDKSLLFGGPSSTLKSRSISADTIVLIPVKSQRDSLVKSFLACDVKADTVLIKLVRDRDYRKYGFHSKTNTITANTVAVQFMRFQRDVYGDSVFVINDTMLFNHKNSAGRIIKPQYLTVHSNATATQNRTSDWIIWTECELVTYGGDQGQVHGVYAYENNNYSYEDVICFNNAAWIDGSYTQSDPSLDPSSSGGSGAQWYDGGTNTTCPGGLNRTATAVTPIGCTPGWTPTYDPGTTFLNPYVAGIVHIDTSISNHFPCVQRIATSLTQYSNLNALAQVALNTVFGINQKIHLTFTSGPNLGQDVDGDTKPDSAYMIGSDFYATIRLNPWMLTNSTQEYTAATIIHEAVHAYIDYNYYLYQTGVIDSTIFKTLFPLFWPPKTLYQSGGYNYYSTAESVQHNAMAANLIQIMADALAGIFPNSNIPNDMRDSIYRSLSWGGLSTTTVWLNKTDTCDIKAINTLAKNMALQAPFVMNGTSSCNNTYTNDCRSYQLTPGCQ
jgi:hypothetical protein